MTEQEKQQLVEAVITQLKNEGTDVSSASVVEDVNGVSYILCYDTNGNIVRVSPDTINQQESTNKTAIEALGKKVDDNDTAIANETKRATEAEGVLGIYISQVESSATQTNTDLTETKKNIASSLHASASADVVNVTGKSDIGRTTFSVNIPAATTEKAGVMSAVDKQKLEDMPKVVQGTGAAKDKVMSQKAVSKEIKRIDALESAFNFEGSINLFNKDEEQNLGYIAGGNGNVSPDTSGNYTYSYAIPIKPNKYYYLSGRNMPTAACIRCLDEDGNQMKVLIASTGEEYSLWNLPNEKGTDISPDGNGQFKTPDSAAYLQFNIKFNTGDADNIMLSLVGDSYVPNMVAPAYQPYLSSVTIKENALPQGFAKRIEAVEELAIAASSAVEGLSETIIDVHVSPNLFDKSKVNLGFITSSGGLTTDASGNYVYSEPIQILPNHYYYLSGRNMQTAANIRCLDINGNPLKVLSAATNEEISSWWMPNADGTGTQINGQFKTPDSAAYLQFNIKFNTGDADNIMLVDLGEEYKPNAVESDYEPYGETSYTIKESAIPRSNTVPYLNGKTIRIFGGSVSRICKTFGGDAVMEALSGCIIQNDGLDGGGYARETQIVDGQPVFRTGGICDHVNKATTAGQPAYDVYVLWSSTNDISVEVGEATDYTYFDNYNINKLVTQCGGLNYCIKKLQEFSPSSRIIVLGSLKAFFSDVNYENKLHQLVEGQEAVAALQSVPFFSLWANGGLNIYNKDAYFTWTEDVEGENRNDGSHPNKWAYQTVIAPKIIKQIAQLY